jgi:hypothetical protein
LSTSFTFGEGTIDHEDPSHRMMSVRATLLANQKPTAQQSLFDEQVTL